MNGNGMDSVGHEAEIIFRMKKRVYLKDKINKFETKNKKKQHERPDVRQTEIRTKTTVSWDTAQCSLVEID
jgi:hypothetical protein